MSGECDKAEAERLADTMLSARKHAAQRRDFAQCRPSTADAVVEQLRAAIGRSGELEALVNQACDWLEARTDKQARTFHAGKGVHVNKHINIIFDGPPSHESGRFVEVEDEAGNSIKVGEWIEIPLDRDPTRVPLYALRLPDHRALSADRDRLAASLAEARAERDALSARMPSERVRIIAEQIAEKSVTPDVIAGYEMIQGAVTALGYAAHGSDAPRNYVEITLVGVPLPFDRAAIHLIRPDGKTPHEMRQDAERELGATKVMLNHARFDVRDRETGNDQLRSQLTDALRERDELRAEVERLLSIIGNDARDIERMKPVYEAAVQSIVHRKTADIAHMVEGWLREGLELDNALERAVNAAERLPEREFPYPPYEGDLTTTERK